MISGLNMRRWSILLATVSVVAFLQRNLGAETIQELVEDVNKKGVITVGIYTFTFDNNSVTGDRTWDQVSLATVGTNGIEFTINPQLRLDSQGAGVAKNASIDIKYSVTSTQDMKKASLSNNAFSQYAANNASAVVTESLNGVGDLVVGVPRTNNVPVLTFDGTMSLTVDNAGRLYTPPRGPGDNQDEAQLSTITNTFDTPEPSSLTISSVLFGAVGVAWRFKHRKKAMPR